jgi:hypothetical protein
MLRPVRSERAERRPRHVLYASLHRSSRNRVPVTAVTSTTAETDSSNSSSSSSDGGSTSSDGSSSSSNSSSSTDSDDERDGGAREFSPRDAGTMAYEEQQQHWHSSSPARAAAAAAKYSDKPDTAVARTIIMWYGILIPLGICYFTALFVYNTSSPPLSESGNGRSVLMIIVDDMRPVQAAYGQQRLGPWNTSFTPNLDSFAEGALSFTRAYAQVR